MNNSKQKEKSIVVDEFLRGETVTNIAKEHQLSRNTVYAWVDEYNSSSKKMAKLNFRYLHDLEQKCKRQEKIIEILQSSPCSANAPILERYDVITAMSDKYNVNTLCIALKVAKGSYYNHIFRNKNGNTLAAKRREEITPIIEQIYNENNQIYGSSKIYAILKARGYSISEDTVAKIMHSKGMFSIRNCAKTLYYQQLERKKDLVQQQFMVYRPNAVWVGDVTQFNCRNKTYYICAILDLYARKVVAHKISMHNNTHLTKATFKMAFTSRNCPKELIFHSDQGSNYTANEYRKYLRSLNVTQSFSKPGTPYDNSVMESFFANFKREELYRSRYKSERDLFESIENYINFYNEERPHSTIMYHTPNNFEKSYFERHKDENPNINGSN